MRSEVLAEGSTCSFIEALQDDFFVLCVLMTISECGNLLLAAALLVVFCFFVLGFRWPDLCGVVGVVETRILMWR